MEKQEIIMTIIYLESLLEGGYLEPNISRNKTKAFLNYFQEQSYLLQDQIGVYPVLSSNLSHVFFLEGFHDNSKLVLGTKVSLLHCFLC